MSDERLSRRRLLLLGSAALALGGAGLGALTRFRDDGAADPDLAVDYTVTPDDSPPDGDSGPTPDTDTDRGTGTTRGPFDRPDATTPTPAAGDGDADDGDVDDGNVDDGDADDGDVDDGDADDGDGRAPPPESTADVTAAAVPPVSLTDVTPGDGGTVDLSLALSGSPARLWVRSEVTAATEGGVVDVERRAGDTEPPGELQDAVRMRLWYDGTLAYEGSLAALSDGGWVALTDACVSPGRHSVQLRWDLPADAPNTVQTDTVSFSLGLAADAAGCG